MKAVKPNRARQCCHLTSKPVKRKAAVKMASASTVLSLDAAAASGATPSTIGGKGYQLACLRSIAASTRAFAVPDGVVVPTAAFERHLLECAGCDWRVPSTEEDAADLRSKITRAPVSADIADALRVLCDGVDSRTTFAVRSSGVSEDGISASYAGMFDTVLVGTFLCPRCRGLLRAAHSRVLGG
jgi:phosphoenolpyruvate synthase/pyruvate phosphate dikinase